MRDPAAIWTPAPDWRSASLERRGWRARAVTGLRQALISGVLDRATTTLAPDAPEVGLWGIAAGPKILVRIARDRALVVAPAETSVSDGWHDGWAVTDVSDGWIVLEISGPEAADVVREGTAADLDADSPSAAVRFAGIIGVLVYRTAEDAVRLHVERGLAPYLWRWLETRPD